MPRDEAGPETAPDLWGTERPLDPDFTPAREFVSEEITNNERRRFRQSDKIPQYLIPEMERILVYTRAHLKGVRGSWGKNISHVFFFEERGEVVGVQDAWEPWVMESEVLSRIAVNRGWSRDTAFTILSGVVKAVHGRKVVPDYDRESADDGADEDGWFGEQIDLEDQIS